MTWRSAVATGVVVGASVLGSGCGEFDRDEARDLVNRVGVERILAAADSLASYGGSGRQELAPESWPSALSDLKPERIDVDQHGVEVTMRGFFAAGEALLIVFRSAEPPKEDNGSDPLFRKVANRIYWVQYKG